MLVAQHIHCDDGWRQGTRARQKQQTHGPTSRGEREGEKERLLHYIQRAVVVHKVQRKTGQASIRIKTFLLCLFATSQDPTHLN